MNRRAALFLLLLLSFFLFLQCSSGNKPGKPRQVERTVQDVDRDLQSFKTAIRSEIKTKDNFILVVGGFSVLVNLILLGFVLYYRKKAQLLAPKTGSQKVSTRKKKPVSPPVKGK